MIRHARVVLIEIAAALSLAAPAFGLASGELLDEISVERLRTHVAALEGPRWSNEAKAVAAAYISAELENYGYSVSQQPALTRDNLIVRISGSVAPEYTFVVGAHYDTVLGSPGADDNASGVAAYIAAGFLAVDDAPPQIAVYDIDSRTIVNRLSLEREPHALRCPRTGATCMSPRVGSPVASWPPRGQSCPGPPEPEAIILLLDRAPGPARKTEPIVR